MQNTLLSIAVLSVLLQADVRLARAGEEEAQSRIPELVRRLGSIELSERVEAERLLRESGADVLRQLPDPRTLSPSAGAAVQRIRTHLERQHVQMQLQPALVDLKGTMSLAAAISGIAEQTSNPLTTAHLPAEVTQQLVWLDLKATPFWEAVGEIEEQGQVLGRLTAEPRELSFHPRMEETVTSLVTTTTGPFRLRVLRASIRPDFGEPTRRLLRFECDVTAEPRLRLLFLHVAARQLTVNSIDRTSDSAEAVEFPPYSLTAQRELPGDRAGPIPFTHDVILPDADNELTSVKIGGTIELELAAGAASFEFRRLNEPGPLSRRNGGVAVTLEDVEHTARQLETTIALRYDVDPPRFESHRSWVFQNGLVLASEGEAYRPSDFQTLREGPSGTRVRYRFENVPPVENLRLSYTAPTLITRFPVQFTFESVPITESADDDRR